jgi:ribosomal protein S6--L-glutamate ligase
VTQFVLLTTSPNGRVAKRFVEEFEKRQAPVVVIAPGDAQDAPRPAVVLPRIAPHANAQGVAALETLAHHGVRVINRPEGWLLSRDKTKAAELFASASISTPVTLAVGSDTSFESCSQTLGLPFVLKVSDGTHGEGVHLVETSEQYAQALGAGRVFIAQQFVAEADGADKRLIVIGGKVVAGMQRQAKAGEFRSNLHLGASGSAYEPTAAEAELAVKAAKAVGLELAGVDIISSEQGPLVLEVNPSPGLQIEAITGVNVAGAMVDYALSVSTAA